MKKNAVRSESQQRLENFRASLISNLSPQSKNCNQNDILTEKKSSLKGIMKKKQKYVPKKYFSPRIESPKLNHYRNINCFRSLVCSPQNESNEFENRRKIFFSDEKKKFRLYWNEKNKIKLSDCITLDEIGKATEFITKVNSKNITRIYAEKLKYFCSEVIKIL